jgi:DNA-binding response OmpR family regulator
MATRHEKENAPPVIRFGPFTLDGRSGELHNGPTRLKVPDQSIAVLQALLERPGELVTREALRDRLWRPDTFVDFEAGLNAAVRRARGAQRLGRLAALRRDAAAPWVPLHCANCRSDRHAVGLCLR